MKYKDWLAEWIENVVRPIIKSRTYSRYKEIIVGHIISLFGECELNDLTPMCLQKFTNELLRSGNLVTGKGLSANTVNIVVTILQSSLKSAAEFGLLREYTADKIKRPKAKISKIGCFSCEEQKKIEEAILRDKKDRFFGVILCLYTGLRIGELLALEWDDVDFEKGVLSINKSCHYGKSEIGTFCRCTEQPKTTESVRAIPIPVRLIKELKKIKKRSESRYVVSNRTNPISVRSYQRSFALLLKRLKIPHKGFHALRHTFATRALECGMDVKTLSDILGHKNTNITLNRYVHSLMEHKREMMNKLGKLLQ